MHIIYGRDTRVSRTLIPNISIYVVLYRGGQSDSSPAKSRTGSTPYPSFSGRVHTERDNTTTGLRLVAIATGVLTGNGDRKPIGRDYARHVWVVNGRSLVATHVPNAKFYCVRTRIFFLRFAYERKDTIHFYIIMTCPVSVNTILPESPNIVLASSTGIATFS